MLGNKAGFGELDEVTVDDLDLNKGSLTLQFIATKEHINGASTLDEGLVATLTDNYTTYLLMAYSMKQDPERVPLTVTVSLGVQGLAPIEPETLVQVVCQIGDNLSPAKPFASAVFRDARNPRLIYAHSTHTKHSKAVKNIAATSSSKAKI